MLSSSPSSALPEPFSVLLPISVLLEVSTACSIQPWSHSTSLEASLPPSAFWSYLLLSPCHAESSFPALVSLVQAVPLTCRLSLEAFPVVSGGAHAAHPEALFKPLILILLPEDTGDYFRRPF